MIFGLRYFRKRSNAMRIIVVLYAQPALHSATINLNFAALNIQVQHI
jgi:hypothetical protein